jgi:hypothetical protein
MEDFMYAALGVDRSQLLAHSALPDAPVVADHPHRLSAAARRLVSRPTGAANAGRHRRRHPRPAQGL